MPTDHPEFIAALRAAGYTVVRYGELGVSLAKHPYYLPWAKVRGFLGNTRSKTAVARTLDHLAKKQPVPWEKRRQEYLEAVGRSER